MEGQGSLQAALATSTAARVEERDPSIVAPGGRAMASSTDSSSSLPASAAPPKEGAIARLARKATERRQARIIARLAKASVRARTAVSCLCGKGDDIPDAAVNLVAELVVFAGAAEEDRAASAVIVLAAVEAAFGLELPIDAACLGAVDSLGNAKAGPSFAYSQLEAVLAALPSWGRDSDAAAQAGRVQAQLRRLHSRCGFGPGVDEVWGVRLCGGLFG
ncbi:hypothetical protein FNF31_07307 [Cafeteria roenbergensis]|nr:hypothetical protein FNF31_07307 [Cafeteria roenbergensis]